MDPKEFTEEYVPEAHWIPDNANPAILGYSCSRVMEKAFPSLTKIPADLMHLHMPEWLLLKTHIDLAHFSNPVTSGDACLEIALSASTMLSQVCAALKATKATSVQDAYENLLANDANDRARLKAANAGGDKRGFSDHALMNEPESSLDEFCLSLGFLWLPFDDGCLAPGPAGSKELPLWCNFVRRVESICGQFREYGCDPLGFIDLCSRLELHLYREDWRGAHEQCYLLFSRLAVALTFAEEAQVTCGSGADATRHARVLAAIAELGVDAKADDILREAKVQRSFGLRIIREMRAQKQPRE